MSSSAFERRAILLAGALAALALPGCSASVSTQSTVNTANAERVIGQSLTKKFGDTVRVSCPEDVEAKAGATFTCTAKAPSGETADVRVTQKDDKGNIRWALDAG